MWQRPLRACVQRPSARLCVGCTPYTLPVPACLPAPSGFSEAFAKYYIVPMCAALWSSSNAEVLDSSAYAMIAFMDNHCMLQVRGGGLCYCW